MLLVLILRVKKMLGEKECGNGKDFVRSKLRVDN